MDVTERETDFSAAFGAVPDTLTTELDVDHLLHTLVQKCVETLGMRAGGIMLADADGVLQLMTATSESVTVVESLQLASGSGPCIDSYKRGGAVSVGAIGVTGSPWPEFSAAALKEGFHSILATPMKSRTKTIGAMSLFGDSALEVNERDAALARALADLTTICILQDRAIHEGRAMEQHLQNALDSRIIIEQAKGVIAHGLTLTMDDAFALLRKHARDRNLTIRSVAKRVCDGDLEVAELATNGGQVAPA